MVSISPPRGCFGIFAYYFHVNAANAGGFCLCGLHEMISIARFFWAGAYDDVIGCLLHTGNTGTAGWLRQLFQIFAAEVL